MSYNKHVTCRVTLLVPPGIAPADAPAYFQKVLRKNFADLSPVVEAVTNTGFGIAEKPLPAVVTLPRPPAPRVAQPAAVVAMPRPLPKPPTFKK